MAWRAPMSTPAVGSQRTSTCGSRASVRPKSTFCWLPPLNVWTGTSGRPSSRRAFGSSRWRSPLAGGGGAEGRPKRWSTDSDRFSPTDIGPTMPSLPRSGGSSATLSPSTPRCPSTRVGRGGSSRRWRARAGRSGPGSSSRPESGRPAMPSTSPGVERERGARRYARPALDLQQRLRVHLLWDRGTVVGFHLDPEHQVHELALGQRRHVPGDHPFAVAQDGHAIGQTEDLVETVRDVEDAGPLTAGRARS